jgi:hypothetical protein
MACGWIVVADSAGPAMAMCAVGNAKANYTRLEFAITHSNSAKIYRTIKKG